MHDFSDDSLLYHYTSAEGLLGMIGSPRAPASLWLSQIQYMNDAEEGRHPHVVGRDVLVRRWRQSPAMQEYMKGIYGFPHTPSGEIEAHPGYGMTRYFVFSLTERGDLLSQWRGYAPTGGYSLGFHVGDLKRLAAANGFQLVRCVYNDDEKRREISEALDQIDGDLARGFVSSEVEALTPQLSKSEQAHATARVAVQRRLDMMATYFKNASFVEEQEWRLVGIVGATDPSRARYRTRGNLIIPYCHLDISSDGPAHTPVRTVTVGPGPDFELAAHAVTFATWGCSPQVEVKRSASTLRL